MSFKPNSQKNGFERNFNQALISLQATVDLKYLGYYIAGFTSDNVFLGNHQTPAHLVKINFHSMDSLHYRISFPELVKFAVEYSKIAVDSPYIYVTEGIKPTLFKGVISDLKVNLYLEDSPAFSSTAIPISPSSMVFRQTNNNLKKNVLVKVSENLAFNKTEADALEPQIDGIFCTDGMLSYDRSSSLLVYLYYYRNEYIRLDTNLNVLNKYNTIDTNRTAKIKVATLASENKTTLSSPPYIVNKKSCLFNRRLYILSALRSDNQSKTEFSKNATIDSYSLEGKYLYSFYIPLGNEEELIDFQIIDNNILALYNTNKLGVFKFSSDSQPI